MRLILNVTTEKELDIALRVARGVFRERPQIDQYFGTFHNLEGAPDHTQKEIAATSVIQRKTGYRIITRETPDAA
jgi:hypothetical protein